MKRPASHPYPAVKCAVEIHRLLPDQAGMKPLSLKMRAITLLSQREHSRSEL